MTTQTQYDLAPANQSEFELTVTQVPDEQRIDFWPQHFGTIPQWTTLEPRIFAWMDRFCSTYSGGIAGVLAVYAERRQDRNGPYACLMSITLN